MQSFSLLDSLTLCVCARRHDDQQPSRTRKERQTCDPLSRTGGGSVPIKVLILTPAGTKLVNVVSGVKLAI
jgi:hypothetical protein